MSVTNRRSSDFLAGVFHPLPGTAREAHEISKIFSTAKVLTGQGATENAIKQLTSPRILHVATHGFFLPDQPDKIHDMHNS